MIPDFRHYVIHIEKSEYVIPDFRHYLIHIENSEYVIFKEKLNGLVHLVIKQDILP